VTPRIWIGGSTCAGKSTFAQTVALGTGWAPFNCDDAFSDQAWTLPRSTLARVDAMSPCERLAQDVATQARDVWTIAEERWPLTLAALGASLTPRAAEGESLLPHLLAAHGVTPDRALFLLISPSLRRERYAQRAWARELVAGCAEPTAAFEAWMSRDDATEERIATEAARFGYRTFAADDPAELDAAMAFARRAQLSQPPTP